MNADGFKAGLRATRWRLLGCAVSRRGTDAAYSLAGILTPSEIIGNDELPQS